MFHTLGTNPDIPGVSIKVLAFPAHATMEDHAAFDYRMSQARHVGHLSAMFWYNLIDNE